MRNLPRQSYFTMKASEGGAVLSYSLGQEFQGNLLAQAQIVGSVNLSHPAFAEQRDDAISFNQDLSWNEAGLVEGRRVQKTFSRRRWIIQRASLPVKRSGSLRVRERSTSGTILRRLR
jgi:hypothetical protein